ncbi:MAG TPA: hypothetical protein VN025_16200 [Candidatus Dormibacteraeota bacterium]|jgi:hypothetical protein|nr:hypothetical protein [Candidatus Dormibacteraeota bacterium]
MNSLIEVCGKQVRVQGKLIRTARLEADKYHFVEDPEAFLEELRACNARIDLFTFVQKLPDTKQKYSYPMEWDNFAALPVTTFDNWWNKQIGFKARNKAKQAQKKGVVVKEVPFDRTLVKGIWEIYNECPIRQGKKFNHYGKDEETVYKDEATFLDTSVFIGAYDGDRLIGFIKMVYDETRTQAGLMNIFSSIRDRDKAPSNALVAQAVKSCADRGISYLVYSNFAYGGKQKSSLSDFKERNAFERMDIPRYYVPLTAIGATALKLGLQHRLSSRIPEPITAKLRELRENWYNRKFPSAKEA